MTISDYVIKAAKARSSDVHLVSNLQPSCRIDGTIHAMDRMKLSPETVESFVKELSGPKFPEYDRLGDGDFALTLNGVRCRVNVFKQQGAWSIVLRLLSGKIPSLEQLNLPPVAQEIVGYRQGLVLVTGETGSGKSTTLAAILNAINKTYNKHILTIEDPIEYIYTPDKCIINQRQLGNDTESFARAMRAALREDPDIIMVGEMRDFDTMESAITAAETGHLVLATLHTKTAAEAVDRIVGVFPSERQSQIRLQLSMVLKVVMSQQLLPRAEGIGRVAAVEVMKVDSSIAAFIREAKTQQINNTISTTSKIGNITMDKAVQNLLVQKLITKETKAEFDKDKAV